MACVLWRSARGEKRAERLQRAGQRSGGRDDLRHAGTLLLSLIHISLYAKWAEKDADPVPEISFQDVPSDAWYAEYVTYLAEKYIVSGKTANTFAPNDFVTRAEFVKIIAGVEMCIRERR